MVWQYNLSYRRLPPIQDLDRNYICKTYKGKIYVREYETEMYSVTILVDELYQVQKHGLQIEFVANRQKKFHRECKQSSGRYWFNAELITCRPAAHGPSVGSREDSKW